MSHGYQGLFDELRAYKRSRVLAVAFSIGLVDAIGNEEMTAGDIAAECRIDVDWASSLLGVLADLEVVERNTDTWKLTRMGKDAAADEALRAFAGYHLHCYEAWLDLPERCKASANAPGFHKRAARGGEFIRFYLRSMDAIAQRNLSFLKRQCQLKGMVLDVGSGPSTFCRDLAETQGCRVTALDLPVIIEEARKLFRCPPGFEWASADFREYEPVQRFDALFCSHLIEYASESELAKWLGRMAGFVRSGGTAAFLTFLRDSRADGASQLNLFELSTGVNGERLGHICTPTEIEETLRTVGASDIICNPLPKGPSYSEYLVTCTWA